MISFNSTYNFSIDPKSPEGIGIQAGIYGGLLICIIMTCFCVKRWCMRSSQTDLVSRNVTESHDYGSVHETATKIIHQRHDSEVNFDGTDTLEKEESVLVLPEDSLTIYDGSEPDLIDIDLSEPEEGKKTAPPLPPRKREK